MEESHTKIDRTEPIENRVYRLETIVLEMKRTEGEMMDRLKNAHHRIDETNDSVREIKENMKALNDKLDNLGINLAEKDRTDKKWHKWVLIIGILAAAAFIGTFIQDTEVRKTIGDIAIKVGVGAASAI